MLGVIMSPNIEKRQFQAGKSNQQLTLVLQQVCIDGYIHL